MILSMTEQARLFLLLAFAGMAAGLVYDMVRVLRRFIRHSLFAIQAEDLIYWLVFTLCIMLIMLKENNGVLRFFSAVAPILGLIVYLGALSPFFLKPMTAVTLFIKRILMVILHIFYMPLAFIGNLLRIPAHKIKKSVYKFNKIIKKLLKKAQKCEKIINGYFRGKLLHLRKSNGSEKVERRGQKKKPK